MNNKLTLQSLYISLDGDSDCSKSSHSTFYAPGQSISGRVVYTPQVQINVEKVVLVLQCTLHTEYWKGRHLHSDNTELLRQEQILFNGPHTVSPTQLEFPFGFHLPQRTDSTPSLESQPLPPSWNAFHTANTIYTLKVFVNPGRLSNSTESCRMINVWPYQHSSLPEQQPVACYLTDDRQVKAKKHSLRDRVGRLLASSPDVNVGVTVKMPRVLGMWQHFPVELAYRYSRVNQSSSETPELVLRHCELTLKADIDFAADENSSGMPRVCGMKIPGKDKEIPWDGSFVGLKTLCLADMVRRVDGLVPNFTINNVSLNYFMKISVHLLHPRTGHVFECVGRFPFQILPSGLSPYSDMGDTASSPPPAFDIDESPPSYDFISGQRNLPV